MGVPLSWLREYVDLPAGLTGRELAAELIAAGLEVETVDAAGADLTGPLVIGKVLAIEELTEFKKPIRWCQVDVGNPEPQNLICGARNFGVGDVVAVVLPRPVLPGGFAVGARQTHGEPAEGLISSMRQMGIR